MATNEQEQVWPDVGRLQHHRDDGSYAHELEEAAAEELRKS